MRASHRFAWLLTVLLVPASVRAQVDPAVVELLRDKPVVLTLSDHSTRTGTLLGEARGRIAVVADDGSIETVPKKRVVKIEAKAPAPFEGKAPAPSEAAPEPVVASARRPVLLNETAVGQRVRLHTFGGDRVMGQLLALDESNVELRNDIGDVQLFPTPSVERVNLIKKVEQRSMAKLVTGWTILVGGDLLGAGLLIGGLIKLSDCETSCGVGWVLLASSFLTSVLSVAAGIPLVATSSYEVTREVDPAVLDNRSPYELPAAP